MFVVSRLAAAIPAALLLLAFPADGLAQPDGGLRKLHEFTHDGWVGGAAYSTDGALLATCGSDLLFRARDLQTGDEKAVLKIVPNVKNPTLESDAASRELTVLLPWGKGTWLIRRPGESSGYEVWNPANKKLGPVYAIPSTVLGLHPTGPESVLALTSGANDGGGKLTLWDVKSKKKMRTFDGPKQPAQFLRFAPDGKKLLTYSSGDRSTRVWDLGTGRELYQLGGADHINAAAISRDGKRAVTGMTDIRVWDLETGKEVRKIDVFGQEGYMPGPRSVAISPDGTRALALATFRQASQTLWLLDLDTGKAVASVTRPYKNAVGLAPQAVEFAPDGKTAVTYRGPVPPPLATDVVTATVWEVTPAGGK